MEKHDPYVERVLRSVPDDALGGFSNHLYGKLENAPTWPFDAAPETLRLFLANLPDVRRAIEALLFETARRTLLSVPILREDGSARYVTRTPTGVEIVAATDRGKRLTQDDWIAIHDGVDFAAVMDGIGGYANADRSAKILAEEFMKNPRDTEASALVAQSRMEEELGEGGTCFASARLRLEETWKLIRDRKGDCRVSTVNPATMTVTSETVDEGYGNIVVNSVHAFVKMDKTTPEPIHDLPQGTVVIVTSDGVHKKMTMDEVAKIIGAYREDLSGALNAIWNSLEPRMSDNRSIVLMRVPED